MPAFKKAIESLLDWEGGYVDHPYDPGGETKYGISKRSYPDLDIKNLELEDAIQIYKRDFWDKNTLALIKDEDIAIKVFQTCVWLGAYRCILLLQRALLAQGRVVPQDGRFGPVTAASVNGADKLALLAAFRSEVAGYIRQLTITKKDFGVFERGWLKRAYS